VPTFAERLRCMQSVEHPIPSFPTRRIAGGCAHTWFTAGACECSSCQRCKFPPPKYISRPKQSFVKLRDVSSTLSHINNPDRCERSRQHSTDCNMRPMQGRVFFFVTAQEANRTSPNFLHITHVVITPLCRADSGPFWKLPCSSTQLLHLLTTIQHAHSLRLSTW